jgi:translation initiation factor 3 subunit E
MIDYTMDIRKRLNMGDGLSDDLIQRRENVIAKLKELQLENAPLMKCMEELKNRESMKDSKTLMNVLQNEYDVSTNFWSYIFCLFGC